MRLLQVTQFLFALLAFEVCILGPGFGQPASNTPLASSSALMPMSVGSVTPVRAFPAIHLTRGLQLTYLGMFSPDAVYRKSDTFDGRVAGEGIRPGPRRSRALPTLAKFHSGCCSRTKELSRIWSLRLMRNLRPSFRLAQPTPAIIL